MYEKHCERLTTIGKELAAKAYGIERNAALNQLTYFHVVDGLPPDVMHDLLEGAVNCEVKVMLSTYIYEKNILTLEQLNRRVRFFKYASDAELMIHVHTGIGTCNMVCFYEHASTQV